MTFARLRLAAALLTWCLAPNPWTEREQVSYTSGMIGSPLRRNHVGHSVNATSSSVSVSGFLRDFIRKA